MQFTSNPKKMLTMIAAAVMVLSACSILMFSEESDADSGTYTVTDGTGKTFTYTEPSEHIVCGGVGAALSIADAGYVSKIVATDKYSTYDYTGYEQLKDLDAVDLKSLYGTTNHDYIVTTLVSLVSEGKMSLDDSIILTSYSSNTTLRDLLEDKGFTHVLIWTSIDSYSGIVDFVKAMNMIAAGTETQSFTEMNETVEKVEAYVDGQTKTPKALYIYSSSGTVKVGNTGLMKTMLDLVGADNIGYDSTKGSSYGDSATIVSLLEDNKDAVVFVQHSYFASGKTVDDFRNEVLGGDKDIKVVAMGLHWNNWCPESAEGLQEIAEALYSYTVTDGTGRTFTYLQPSVHVVCGGSGASLTIADAGYVSKIVAADYSSAYSYNNYEPLKNLDAVDLKSFYGTTNHEYIETTLVNMVSEGKLSLDDTIILTSFSSNATLRDLLEGDGFTHVLIWNSVSDYNGIVDFVEAMNMIVAGEDTQSLTDMKATVEKVENLVKTQTGKPKALYVAYYKSALTIGNTGLMKSMLDIVGADNIGYDSTKGTNYGDTSTIVSLLEDNKDAVVFIQHSYFTTGGKTLDDFYNEVLGGDRSIKVVAMGLHWNNWCPESAEGLQEIYDTLYTSSPAPSGGTSSDNTLIIAVGIVAAIVVIGAVAFVAVRMRH